MAKRKTKRTNQCVGTNDEPHLETNEASKINEEVERQISTIKAMSEMELEHLLTGVRLLRSYISEEHLQIPVSQFCKEYLPNLLLVKDGKDGHYSLRWKEEDGSFAMRNGDARDFSASLLHHISMGYPKIPNLSAALSSFDGLQISSKGMNSSLPGGDAPQFGNYAMREPSNMQSFGFQDGLHTPGVCIQRMSVGMTPKTLRLPKPGEMLLSVRGSPLGVYKEDKVEEDNANLEAICETEND